MTVDIMWLKLLSLSITLASIWWLLDKYSHRDEDDYLRDTAERRRMLIQTHQHDSDARLRGEELA